MSADSEFSVSRKQPERPLFLGLLALTFATYASTLTFGWVWDDRTLIANSPVLQWRNLGFMLTHHFFASLSPLDDGRYYRPFVQIWFLLNKTLFGVNPHWFHFTTIGVHMAVVTMTFLICRMVLQDSIAALVAAAVYALHPLQVETVSWVSDVADSLAAFFSLASLFAAFKSAADSSHRRLWVALSLVAFALGLCTKEVTVMVAPLILLYVWLGARRRQQPLSSRQWLVSASGYAAIGLVWLLLRRIALGNIAQPTSHMSWPAAVVAGIRLLAFYASKVLLPVGLAAHYDLSSTSHGPIQIAIAVAAVIAIVVVAAYAALRKHEAAIALACILVPLAPALCVPWMNNGDPAHDRYFYVSMLGVALLAGLLFRETRRRVANPALLMGLTVVLITSMAFASAIQSQYWANDLALFTRAVTISPNSAWAHYELGFAFEDAGKFQDAERQFVRTYQMTPGPRASREAAQCFLKSGDMAQAEFWYQRYLGFEPRNADAWFNVAQIRIAQHRPAEAVAPYRQALALSPADPEFHAALAKAYEQVRQPGNAFMQYEEALRLDPQSTAAREGVVRLSRQSFSGRSESTAGQ